MRRGKHVRYNFTTPAPSTLAVITRSCMALPKIRRSAAMKRGSPLRKPAEPARGGIIMTRVPIYLAAAAALAVLAAAVPASADLRPDDTGRHTGSWHGGQWDADPAVSHGYAYAPAPATNDASPASCVPPSACFQTAHGTVGID
jgi:hypothetical protein